MIINGREIAAGIRKHIREKIDGMDTKPKLTVVLVGNDPASSVYVNMKSLKCREVGIESDTIRLPAKTSEDELLGLVDELNNDESVDGILVQLPLPEHISDTRIIRAISPAKDVDGLHPVNLGLTLLNKATLVACTPKGVMRLLDASGIDCEGKHAVVVGRSNIVGKPIAQLLLHANATVTICHSRTKDLGYFTRNADILVAAVGKPEFITKEDVKEGATVIDVGVNRMPDESAKRGYRLVGDVSSDVGEKAGRITPVPGGVGPMTIAMLLENTLLAAEARR